MLSNYNVQHGRYALYSGRLHYDGEVITSENPQPMISWGGEEIYVFPQRRFLAPYIVVIVAVSVGVKIHPCSEYAMAKNQIILRDEDGKWYGYRAVGGHIYPYEDKGYFRIYPFTPEKK